MVLASEIPPLDANERDSMLGLPSNSHYMV